MRLKWLRNCCNARKDVSTQPNEMIALQQNKLDNIKTCIFMFLLGFSSSLYVVRAHDVNAAWSHLFHCWAAFSPGRLARRRSFSRWFRSVSSFNSNIGSWRASVRSAIISISMYLPSMAFLFLVIGRYLHRIRKVTLSSVIRGSLCVW